MSQSPSAPVLPRAKNARRSKALILEPEPIYRHLLSQIAESHGFDPAQYGSLKEGIDAVRASGPSVMLLNYELEDGTAFEFLDAVEIVSGRIIPTVILSVSPQESVTMPNRFRNRVGFWICKKSPFEEQRRMLELSLAAVPPGPLKVLDFPADRLARERRLVKTTSPGVLRGLLTDLLEERFKTLDGVRCRDCRLPCSGV